MKLRRAQQHHTFQYLPDDGKKGDGPVGHGISQCLAVALREDHKSPILETSREYPISNTSPDNQRKSGADAINTRRGVRKAGDDVTC